MGGGRGAHQRDSTCCAPQPSQWGLWERESESDKDTDPLAYPVPVPVPAFPSWEPDPSANWEFPAFVGVRLWVRSLSGRGDARLGRLLRRYSWRRLWARNPVVCLWNIRKGNASGIAASQTGAPFVKVTFVMKMNGMMGFMASLSIHRIASS